MAKIEYTNTSGILENHALELEVDVDKSRLLSLYTTDDQSWTVAFGQYPNQVDLSLSWEEFLEIVHQMQLFVNQENMRIINQLQRPDNAD